MGRQRDADDSSSKDDVNDDNATSYTDDDHSEYTKNSNSSNAYVEAFYGIMLPLFIWSICFLRAWQFQSLIEEAELEMQMRFDEILSASGGVNNSIENGNSGSVTTSSNGHDLRLQ